MSNILGLAAIAGNAAQDQIIARRKDQVLQDEEEAARANRAEFASRRGLRDDAAAFESEKIAHERRDLSKADSDKQALLDSVKQAAADFDAQNPYRMAPPATATDGAAPAPQSAAGIAPPALDSSIDGAPASMASGGIGGTINPQGQMPASHMDGGNIARAAGGAGLPNDMGTLNRVVDGVNGGASPTAAAAAVAGPLGSKMDDPAHNQERAAYIAQAMADQHLTNGDLAGYQKASDDAIAMRNHLRTERFSEGDARFAMNGDASIYAKLIYPLIHDGYSLVDASQSSGADGKPVVTMTRRNDQTGKTETQIVPVDKFLNGVKEIRRPGALAALEEQIATEKRTVANKIAEGAPALKNAKDIAEMRDKTERITANANATHAYASAGLLKAQTAVVKGAVAPVWNDKGDAYLEKNYAIKNEVTGAVSVDGNGMQFAKKIALGQAKQNGGDILDGLAYALDVDTRLKAKVDAAVKADPKADPKALLRDERANYLKVLTTPKALAPAAPGAAAPAAAVPANAAAAGYAALRAAPNAAAAPADAPVDPMPAIAKAIGLSGDKTMNGIVTKRAQSIAAAIADYRTEQANFLAASKAGDQVATDASVKKMQDARTAALSLIDATGNAKEAVLQAAGI